MALNPKQRRFVAEYLVDQNATKAALRANYAKKSAHSQAHDLLKKPEIKAEIQKGLDAQIKAAEKRAEKKGLTKERWLEELRVTAFANMEDYATIEEQELYINGSEGEPVQVSTVKAVLSKDRPRRLGRAIKKLSETKNGIGIELHSKQGALEQIGKHYGWLKNEVDLNLPGSNVQVIITLPSNGREAKKPDGGNGST